MEFKHKSGIYMCTCSGNNKSYIGQAQDVKLRKCQHLSELRGKCHFNQYLQNSYNKYKEYSFSWTVLEYCDESELDEREIYWIAYYDTYKNPACRLCVKLRDRSVLLACIIKAQSAQDALGFYYLHKKITRSYKAYAGHFIQA